MPAEAGEAAAARPLAALPVAAAARPLAARSLVAPLLAALLLAACDDAGSPLPPPRLALVDQAGAAVVTDGVRTALPGFETWLTASRVMYRQGVELRVVDLDASGAPVDDRSLTPGLPAHTEILAVAPSPDGTQLAYFADVDVDGAYTPWVVATALPAAPPVRLGDAAIDATAPGARLRWCHDSRQLRWAARDVTGSVQLWSATAGGPLAPQATPLTSVPGGIDDWDSPRDCTAFTYFIGPELWLASVIAPVPRRLAANAREAAWAPDSRWLVYSAVELTEFELFAVRTTAPRSERVVIFGSVFGADVRFSPDAARLVFASPGGLFVAYDGSSSFGAAELLGPVTVDPADGWSDDGRFLTVTTGDATLALFDFSQRPPSRLTLGPVSRPASLASGPPFAPASSWLAWSPTPDTLLLRDLSRSSSTALATPGLTRWQWAP